MYLVLFGKIPGMWFCPEKILRMEFYVVLFGRIAGKGFLFGLS